MPGKNTIVINGKVYDVLTGLPVAAPDKPAAKAPASHAAKPVVASHVDHHAAATTHSATKTHQRVQRSKTLRRDILKKPASNPQTVVGQLRRKPASHSIKSPQVHKFAPARHGTVRATDIVSHHKPKATPPVVSSIVAQKHSLVHPARQAPVKLTTRSVKDHVIADRMTRTHTAPAHVATAKKGSLFSRRPRTLSIASAMVSVMVLGGYLTYLNMPSLSVRVAASQAGIAADFPDYHPDGYRFGGPVAFAPGQVSIKFLSNGSDAQYTVTQQKSTWDSQAVHDNLVASTAGNDYVTNSQQGLTIYTFKNNAAWVNRGILYTVSGDAPLSNEQLLRIAGSM